MKQLNIYQEFLQYCSPRTEEDIVSIEQLDYQNGRYNDFNAPSIAPMFIKLTTITIFGLW